MVLFDVTVRSSTTTTKVMGTRYVRVSTFAFVFLSFNFMISNIGFGLTVKTLDFTVAMLYRSQRSSSRVLADHKITAIVIITIQSFRTLPYLTSHGHRSDPNKHRTSTNTSPTFTPATLPHQQQVD